MADEITLTARWVFPAWGPPIAGGTLTFAEGRIVAVEPHGERRADRDLGDAAILPGFVNAHTHLDLTDAAGKCPPGPDFTAWLHQVIAHRRAQTEHDVRRAVADGAARLLRTGTTLVGDVSGQGASWDVLDGAPLQAVVYHEVLGLAPERARRTLRQATDWLEHRPASANCVAGLSPHAPYSVSFSLFQSVLGYVQRAFEKDGRRIPLAIHLAESAAERELLEFRRGPFVEFLKGLGLWEAADREDGLIDYWAMAFLGVIPRDCALIHGNFLDPERELAGSVVYCPRTHAAFGHPPHPVRRFLERNLWVGLGTDSLASNPDLDVLSEARFLARRGPDLPGASLLHMLTMGGAWALGKPFAHTCGSLTPGKDASFVVLPLPAGDASDPHDLLFHSDLAPAEVYFRGEPRPVGLRSR